MSICHKERLDKKARDRLIKDIEYFIKERKKLSSFYKGIKEVIFEKSKLRTYYDYKAGLFYFTYKGETIKDKDNFKWHSINDFGYFYHDTAIQIIDFLQNMKTTRKD
ncbi:hypothetical protein XJ32_03690 [Helicobacter bilis]|uniref:Uncharacterized protein n=1 Tax=Helicobacter bilis TaxID=37372 RepID=A0A1Q2LFZ5_9HELI|nr:hypothetical protein [Helicobacter bilis]AQQ59341.1 hypothetical protein XJ32_03690 [Helicobacter bilis]